MKIRFSFIFKKQELYILLYFLVYIIHYFSKLNMTATFMLWVLVGMLGLFGLNNEINENITEMRNLLIIDILGGVALLINGSHSVVNVFILILSQMLGLYIYSYKESLNRLSRLTYIVLAYMVFYVFTTPKVLVNEAFGEYMTRFSSLVGGNTISIFCMLFIFIDLIRRHYQNLKINYIVVLSAFIISVVGGGIGGVLAIGALIVGLICIDWRGNRLSITKITGVLLSAAIVLFLFKKKGYSIGLDDNSRFWIWSKYLLCARNSLKDLIFGGSVRNIPFLNELNNMHNTFLNWHFYYGLIPFMFFIGVVIRTLIFNIRSKNWYLALIIGCSILRAFTDETTFCFMPIWTYAYLDMKCVKKGVYKKSEEDSEVR